MPIAPPKPALQNVHVSGTPVEPGYRVGQLTHVEVRTATDGGVNVKGHAAVFNIPTQIGPANYGFREIIAPGAFTKTLADKADVRFLFNHNPDLILARSTSGTLNLTQDKIGLAVEANLAPTSVGKDLGVLLDRGDVSQMSFGFQVVKDRWESEEQSDGTVVETRTVLEARLFDVSAVTYPAYDETDLAKREAKLVRELRDAKTATRAVADTDVADGDPDEDPATLAQAIDEALDGALAAWDDNAEQAKALVVAAAASVDTLLEVIGAADPDEMNDGGARSADPQTSVCSEPAPATPRPDEVDETRLSSVDLLMRHAFGEHRTAPRQLCPACTRSEPAQSTPAA